jgi:hypothetical protein
MIYNGYEPEKDEVDKSFNEVFPKFDDDIKLLNLSSTTVMSGANSFDWKTKRIYEDDDFIIDLVDTGTPTLRVSIFKDNHFQDEVFIRKDDYIG